MRLLHLILVAACTLCDRGRVFSPKKNTLTLTPSNSEADVLDAPSLDRPFFFQKKKRASEASTVKNSPVDLRQGQEQNKKVIFQFVGSVITWFFFFFFGTFFKSADLTFFKSVYF